MSINFDIITEKKNYIWVLRTKIKRYFKIKYCVKQKGLSVLINDDSTYIIEVFKEGMHFIISDNTEEYMDNKVDEFIRFIDSKFKNTTIGFRQETGKKISMDKFKNLKIIELGATPYSS